MTDICVLLSQTYLYNTFIINTKKSVMGASKVRYEKECPVCGKRFMAKTLYSVYCGIHCSKKARVMKEREEIMERARIERVEEMSLSSYIPVSQAVDLYQISKYSIYRLIKSGVLPALQFGPHLIRINRSDLESLNVLKRPLSLPAKKKTPEKHHLYSYRFDQTDCYTVGEINRKFALHDTTIWSAIRKNGIPICYRGNYAFVPKDLIDALFSNQKKRR